jgi:proline iminopeptidase
LDTRTTSEPDNRSLVAGPSNAVLRSRVGHWLLPTAFVLAACGGEAPIPEASSEVRDTLPVQEGYVTTDDGTRLFYRMVGAGPQAVVVPVGFYLEEALAPLAATHRRLVFYDPRGRGRSDAVDTSQVSLDHQIRDVESVRRAFGLERIALIGWSGLGMEMVVYAVRHPDRVTRVVQVAPVAARNTPHNERAYAERLERMDSVELARFQERRTGGAFEADPEAECRAQAEVTRPVNFADTTHLSEVPDVCVHPNEWPSNLGPFFQALLGSFGDYDWRDSLRSLEVPRLVIHGAQDAFPVEGSREWVAGLPNARLMVLDGAGHFPFLERPDVFFPAVHEFLDGKWPDSAEALAGGADARTTS